MPDHEGRSAVLPDQLDGAPGAPGGALDDIRSGIKVWADLAVNIGDKLDESTRATRDLLARLERNTPVDYQFQASDIGPAAGNLVLPLGKPDLGTYWEVMSVAVGGLDTNVSAAGTAGLYTNAVKPRTGDTVSPGITSLRDQVTATGGLPNVGFYGTRQLLVHDSEHLFVVIYGASAGQQYGANVRATVYNVVSAAGKTDIVA